MRLNLYRVSSSSWDKHETQSILSPTKLVAIAQRTIGYKKSRGPIS